MNILFYIKNYWVQIIYIISLITGIIRIIISNREATRCSLRNDILTIYEQCKKTNEISLYQLQSVEMSYSLYKKIKGNSFIDEIIKKIRTFKIID